MKLVKKASGKTTIKMSKSEWTNMGKKAGWLKVAQASLFLASLQNYVEGDMVEEDDIHSVMRDAVNDNLSQSAKMAFASEGGIQWDDWDEQVQSAMNSAIYNIPYQEFVNQNGMTIPLFEEAVRGWITHYERSSGSINQSNESSFNY